MNQTEALFAKSARRLQQGDAAGARKGLLKVVKQAPGSAVAWYNLGLSHQYLEEHARAAAAYSKVVKINPDFVDGWVNLGVSQKAMGYKDEAATAAERAIAIDPNHPRALNLLGTLAAERGEQDKARKYFASSLESYPDFDDARFNLANLLVEMGEQEAALETAGALFLANSENKAYRQLHAKALMGLRRFEEASEIVKALEERYPEDQSVMRLSLSFREVIRDYFGAIDVAEKIIEKKADDASVWNSLGSAHFQLDSIGKAKNFYETAIRLDPSNAEYENNLGLAFSSLGSKAEAEQHYRHSLELNPRHAEAYRSIATMKRFESTDDPDARAIIELWNQGADDFTMIKLSFALGKIYDDCGEYDKAFDTYARGNELKFKDSRIDLEQYFAHMKRFTTVFDGPPVNTATAETEIKPIFILGMPRSGTTLVEQIVSRHPLVFGCGELPCIERAIGRIEKRSGPQRVYPEDFWEVPASSFNAEALEYENWVRRLHDIGTPFITDKMPFNFVHIWLIKAMFPEAPIVHCQRHPLDVITSNYFQLYGSDISFVYDLEALTTYYVRYFRLIQHWSCVFGGAITHIRYEELIQDSDAETRKLIASIGLPWDDACLDPKRSDTAVRTASIWQVRQGIYTTSKERWRHYEKQLAPAIEMLVGEEILNEDLSVNID